jgi:UTP--glucose-1-phosphate uridylyltransferase
MLQKFINKMRREEIPEAAIDVFSQFYHDFIHGKRTTIRESDLLPMKTGDIGSMDQMGPFAEKGNEGLKKIVVIKLNGGLGTTMGLQAPKSLIEVKNGLSFLEITLNQIHRLGERLGVTIPLSVMNSFFTHEETLRELALHTNLPAALRGNFLQHKFPKVNAVTLGPASCPNDVSREWNPAGHGDLLLALDTSGLLATLLEKGYRYLFVSNIDNLGASVDPLILGYFISENLDFLMEVTDRTPMDRKGGHLARLKNGRLTLREAAQCDPADAEYFSDLNRHPFFNTNNLWFDLVSVDKAIRTGKCSEFPFVINRKKLITNDPSSPDMIHIESALGSAISLFDKSAAIRVPRSRFAPVKNCDELLLIRSDYFLLNDDYRIQANPDRTSQKAQITLDPACYARIDQIKERFPQGAPSLVQCDSLSIKGDVKFGRNVVVKGNVSITNAAPHQALIEDNRVLSGAITF